MISRFFSRYSVYAIYAYIHPSPKLFERFAPTVRDECIDTFASTPQIVMPVSDREILRIPCNTSTVCHELRLHHRQHCVFPIVAEDLE